MEEKIVDPMDDTELSPADYAAQMLERTDENGILAIPEINFTDGLDEDIDENAEAVFEMAWDSEKLKELIGTFDTLYGEISRIAENSLTGYDSPDDPDTKAAGEEAAKYLTGGILDDAVVLRARRICALLKLHAPEIITRNEARRLIEVLALTRFSKREICR